MSHTLGYVGDCLWCRQVAREKMKGERREYVKGRLMDNRNGVGRGGGRGRYVQW